MKKIKLPFVVLVVLCLVLTSFSSVEVVMAESKTIVVPDDFSTVQVAIDNAGEGDTVFVKNGVYPVDENTTIVIDKTLSLIGEDPKNTVILGVFSMHPGNDIAIRVAAPNVTISGFTITNCRVAIAIANYYDESYPSGCKIINNNIVNNSEGIRPQRNNVFISGNNITRNSSHGISGYNAQNIVITKNNITENHYGIYIGISRNVTVGKNNISSNEGGLNLIYYGPYLVYENNFTKNNWAIRFAEGCQGATVYGNRISENSVGVWLLTFPNGGDVAFSGGGNTVFGNVFVDNSEAVIKDEIKYGNIEIGGSKGTDVVMWNNGTLGNFWSDHDGVDDNGDGIADTAYVIDENNKDNYPLMKPVTVPEFPSWIILALFLVVTFSVVVFKKRLLIES